jgi:hypothetical protein
MHMRTRVFLFTGLSGFCSAQVVNRLLRVDSTSLANLLPHKDIGLGGQRDSWKYARFGKYALMACRSRNCNLYWTH